MYFGSIKDDLILSLGSACIVKTVDIDIELTLRILLMTSEYYVQVYDHGYHHKNTQLCTHYIHIQYVEVCKQ